MDKYFNNTSLLKVILKWKFHIIAITIIAAILGAIFSSAKFITPLYKSEAILYPSNVSAYSDETFTEQMLQIMESQEIMDSVVEDFDLLTDYKIDKNYKYWKTALIREYRDNVSISKTPYDAIKIKVLDKDPQQACDMVNDIIHLYDRKVGKLHKIKRYEVVKMYQKQLAEKMRFIDSLKKELSFITTNYGIIDYSYQSKEITKGYLSNSNINKEGVDEMLKNMGEYGPTAISLVQLIKNESINYSAIKLDYEQELRFYNSEMTFSNIISEPFVADRKAYPIRWVIVALCGICAFLLSVIVVYLFDNKKLRSKE